MSGHYIKKCKACDAFLGQCRCAGMKVIVWDLCEKCKTKDKTDDANRNRG